MWECVHVCVRGRLCVRACMYLCVCVFCVGVWMGGCVIVYVWVRECEGMCGVYEFCKFME